MKKPAASTKIFVCGASESGKTEYLRRVWLPRLPRLLIVDMTEEWADEPGAIQCLGYDRTIDALDAVAELPEWKIVANLTRAEVERLASVLVQRGKTRTGYVAQIGGMAILLDECHMILKEGYCSEEVMNLYRIGRHAGLTVLSATQRPGPVSKEVTSQSKEIVVFFLFEPNDLDYLVRLAGKDRVETLKQHIKREYHYAVFRRGEMTLHSPAPLPRS